MGGDLLTNAMRIYGLLHDNTPSSGTPAKSVKHPNTLLLEERERKRLAECISQAPNLAGKESGSQRQRCYNFDPEPEASSSREPVRVVEGRAIPIVSSTLYAPPPIPPTVPVMPTTVPVPPSVFSGIPLTRPPAAAGVFGQGDALPPDPGLWGYQ